MDGGEHTKIYLEILLGKKKEDSRYVKDAESSEAWDRLSKEIEKMRAENPNIQFDIPNDP